MFDSSLAKGREPLEFQLGKGKVIKGNLYKPFFGVPSTKYNQICISSLVGYSLRLLNNNIIIILIKIFLFGRLGDGHKRNVCWVSFYNLEEHLYNMD